MAPEKVADFIFFPSMSPRSLIKSCANRAEVFLNLNNKVESVD
jgi:hypothetical protein